MPCESYRDPDDRSINKDELDVITRLACAYCLSLESKGFPVPYWGLAWWSEHKEKDAKQAKIDQDMKAREELWRSLTPEQRRLLQANPWGQ